MNTIGLPAAVSEKQFAAKKKRSESNETEMGDNVKHRSEKL